MRRPLIMIAEPPIPTERKSGIALHVVDQPTMPTSSIHFTAPVIARSWLRYASSAV
jgi:hypothetical protein